MISAISLKASAIDSIDDVLEKPRDILRSLLRVTDKYDATLRRIQDLEPEVASLARRAFAWIIHSFVEVPTANLVRYALSASSNSGPGWRYTKGNRRSLQLILPACGGLIEERQVSPELVAGRLPTGTNSGSKGVCFFREYSGFSQRYRPQDTPALMFRPLKMPDSTARDHVENSPFLLSMENPHAMICAACIAFLLAYMEELRSLRSSSTADLDGTPESWLDMLVYADEHWGHHAREAAKLGPLPPDITGFLKSCREYPWRRLCQSVSAAESEVIEQGVEVLLVGGLHLAMVYGLVDIIRTVQLPYPEEAHGAGDLNEHTLAFFAYNLQTLSAFLETYM